MKNEASLPDIQNDFASFVNQLQSLGLSDNTRKSYLNDLRQFSQWLAQSQGEPFAIANITPHDLIDYKSYLKTVKEFQTATINRHLSSISRFLKWARQEGLTETEPPERLQEKIIQPMGPHSLTRKEQGALLRAVEKRGKLRDVVLIKLLLHTGLRCAEVAELKVDDLEILPRSANEEKGWVHVRAGKGGASRSVPLNSEVRRVLLAYLEVRDKELKKAVDPGYLLIGERGRLTTKGVAYLVRKFAYQAELQNCSVHTLRHTFANNLIDKGVSIDRVGLLLGHASLDTTKIYTRPTKVDLEHEVEKLALL